MASRGSIEILSVLEKFAYLFFFFGLDDCGGDCG